MPRGSFPVGNGRYDAAMSEVRRLWIDGPAGRLEALLRVAECPTATAVVGHPHPLHGGTMHNPVVFHADREVHRLGWTTLRFNFRGTGASEGVHDEARGEVDDVAAAMNWLRGLAPARPQLYVGYSFGSICGIRLAARDPHAVDGLVAIGLPVRVFELPDTRAVAVPLAVVQGSHDEFGTPAEVELALAGRAATATLHVVDGASHLFPGRAPEVGRLAAEAARELLATLGPPPIRGGA